MNVLPIIPYSQLTLGQKLAKTAHADVHLSTSQQVQVVIKEFRLSWMNAEGEKEFVKEAQIIAQLNHPHVVRLFGICNEPSHYCLVIEYVAKGALQTLLASTEPLTWQTRLQIGYDMTLGLAYLHEQKILHRDMKSGSVLIDEGYRAKLTDFGLAKVKDATLMNSSARGRSSLAWSSPELFDDPPNYSEKSDIYALGMTFWELCSRQTPYAEWTNPAIIMKKIYREKLPSIPSDTPAPFAMLIRACWNHYAEVRPLCPEILECLRPMIQPIDPQPNIYSSGYDSSSYPSRMSATAAAVSAFIDDLLQISRPPASKVAQAAANAAANKIVQAAISSQLKMHYQIQFTSPAVASSSKPAATPLAASSTQASLNFSHLPISLELMSMSQEFYKCLGPITAGLNPGCGMKHVERVQSLVHQSPFKPHLLQFLEKEYHVHGQDMDLVLNLICLSYPLFLPTLLIRPETREFSKRVRTYLDRCFPPKQNYSKLIRSIQELAFRCQGHLRDKKFNRSIKTEFGTFLIEDIALENIKKYFETNQIVFDSSSEAASHGTVIAVIDQKYPIGVEYIGDWDLDNYPLDVIRLADLLDITKDTLLGFQTSAEFRDLCLVLNEKQCKYSDLSQQEASNHARNITKVAPGLLGQSSLASTSSSSAETAPEVVEEFLKTLDETSIWTYGGYSVIERVSINPGIDDDKNTAKKSALPDTQNATIATKNVSQTAYSPSSSEVEIIVHVNKEKFEDLNYNKEKQLRSFQLYIPHFGVFMKFKVGFAENAIWQVLRRMSSITIGGEKKFMKVIVKDQSDKIVDLCFNERINY